MKKTILGCLGAAAVAFTVQFTPVNVQAGLFSDCAPCDEITDCDLSNFDSCDPCDSVCGTKAGKWFVNGFIEAGFWANEYGNKNQYDPTDTSRHNVSMAYGNTWALQNVAHTGFQANQVYFSVGRRVDGKHGWDFGGQADFVFGTDARLVQSTGLEIGTTHDDYGWGTGDYYSAFAQAYFQAAYKNLNVYAGKFYSPFGAQEFRGDNNFFYSFAPNYQITPATVSGVYTTYKLSNRLTVLGGWIQPNQIGESSDYNNAFFGGAILQATKRLNLKYVAAFGRTNAYYGSDDPEYFIHSLVATYNLNKKWKAVVDWSLRHDSYDAANVDFDNTIWGVNAALFYQYTKTLAFGLRYNYVDTQNNYYNPHGYGFNDYEYSAISLGANWTPTRWLIVKPEVRYDLTDRLFTDGYGNPEDSQFSGGVSTVVKF